MDEHVITDEYFKTKTNSIESSDDDYIVVETPEETKITHDISDTDKHNIIQPQVCIPDKTIDPKPVAPPITPDYSKCKTYKHSSGIRKQFPFMDSEYNNKKYIESLVNQYNITKQPELMVKILDFYTYDRQYYPLTEKHLLNNL